MWKNNRITLRDRLPSMGMRTRLILAFALFTAAAIGILWVLQTFFLDNLYETVKYRELERCAARLETSLGTEAMEDAAFDLTQEYNLCLSVYQIQGGTGRPVTEQHARMFCLLPMVSTPELLMMLYQEAEGAEDGIYTEEISMDTLFPEHDMASAEAHRQTEDHTRSILHVQLYDTANGQFMVLFATELMPLSATVQTLQLQMIVLTILLASLVVPVLPYLLAFAAGAMLYVVVEELIPEMSEGEHSNIGTVFFAIGFTLMMVLDVALG